MRLYLLPLSTRRTLLYGQRLNIALAERQTVADRVATRAAALWASWEAREAGWQRRVVDGGNALLRRVPYEEWALKSVPPLSARRRAGEKKKKEEESDGAAAAAATRATEQVEVVYPESVVRSADVEKVLLRLASERQAHHKKWLFWCFVGMPLSAPFALVPIIPNLPFFYLVYRAWSHWRALAGGKHVRFLLENGHITLRPSPALDDIYKKAGVGRAMTQDAVVSAAAAADTTASSETTEEEAEEEGLLLTQERGREAALLLGVPQLETELERAVHQVESSIAKKEGGEKQAAEAAAAQESSSSSSSDDSGSDSDSDSESEREHERDYKRRNQARYAAEKIEYHDDAPKVKYDKKHQ